MKKAPNSPVSLKFSPPPPDITLPVRLVLMGDHRSGMTSLLRRYCVGLFQSEYRSEVAKVMRHTKEVFHPRRGSFVTVEFWDLEGSDTTAAFQCALRAHSCAVVYDVTNRSSFENAQKYFDFINPMASSLLIGNKIDLKDIRRVSYEEGRLLAKIHRVKFIETSAKINYNIDEAFQSMLMSVPGEYLVCRLDKKRLAERCRGCNVCVYCRHRRQQLGSTGSSTSSADDTMETTDEEDTARRRCHSPASLLRITKR